jgi:hypothetical protein
MDMIEGKKRHGNVLKLRQSLNQKRRVTTEGPVTQTSILKALADDANLERDLMTKTSKKFAQLSNKLKMILRQ